MATSNLSKALILVFAANTLRAQAACYWPDGTVGNAGLLPCPGSAFNVCCYSEDACLSDGLCLSLEAHIYRGGCTDKAWGNCPSYCAIESPSSVANMMPCDYGLTYCCGLTNETRACCDSTSASSPGKYMISRPSTMGCKAPLAAPNNASSSADSSVTTQPSLAASSSSHSALPVATCPPNHTTAVGASLGSALGLAVLGILGLLLLRHKERKNIPAQPELKNPNQPVHMLGDENLIFEASSRPKTETYEISGPD